MDRGVTSATGYFGRKFTGQETSVTWPHLQSHIDSPSTAIREYHQCNIDS